MAYQTFRVEITRDETRDDGPVGIEITGLYRPHARDQRGHDRAVEPGVARGMEQSAAIHRRFRDTGRGARRDHGGLSRGRPHPLLRIFRRQRISGRGGAAPAIRGEMAARRLAPPLTPTAAEAPPADPSAGDYARPRRCGCRGSRSIAYPPWSSRDNAGSRRYSARSYSNRIVDSGRPDRRDYYSRAS